jgi:pimeloyl-ACP methyl ester carboxylesterase
MLTRVVETDCGPVEFTDAGAGDPVLYFHGTGMTGDAMVSVESRLIDDGFRLILPNRPGYGQTPLAPHESVADCGNVAAALLDSLGIAKVSVMRSSGRSGASQASVGDDGQQLFADGFDFCGRERLQLVGVTDE